MHYLRQALRNSERVYDLVIGDKIVKLMQEEQWKKRHREELEEHLFNLGLVEEGIAEVLMILTFKRKG